MWYGPTASGKTSLGIKIAKRINGEIISADSMQIYRGLNIGTAKASMEEKNAVPHHLIDICNITENFSVGQYKKICYQKIEEILQMGKVPVIVGGTGLYINAVVNNMNFNDDTVSENQGDIKEELGRLLREKGKEYMYFMLEKLDKEAASKIHMNNAKRVLRALEMAMLGQKKTDIEEKQSLWEENDPPYDFFVIYIDMPREKLYDRINQRVDLMVNEGLLDEVIMIKNANLDSDSTAMQAIGYKEFFDYIDKKATLEECVKKLKQNTRKYAKRQITWFKKLNKDYIYKNGEDISNIIEIICKI